MNDTHEIEIDDDDGVLAVGGPLDGAVVVQAPVPAIATDEDFEALFGEGEDVERLDDLDLPDDPSPAVVAVEDPRVAKLEATLAQLTGVAVAREQSRVRRKVTAATGGAGLVGFIPIVLQLAGALNLDPELASTLVAAAAVVGAFAAGWVTPERRSTIVAEALEGH